MRDFVLKMAVCLIVLGGLVCESADAAQRTRQRKVKGERPNQTEAYALDDIMKSPKEFLERDVMFYCRFATTANLFKQINTRFNVNSHVNFAVWPDKAVLWTADGRKNVLPTLYIAKNDPEVLDVLHDVKKYELIAVTGRVLNVYARYPWILVTKIERIEKPSERLCEQVVEHMQSGLNSLDAAAGGAAARHFEQALQFGLPHEYRAAAYKQLAQAYLLESKLDRARGYLRQAVEINRSDPVLHLALADVCLQMYDPGEALAHATFALERSGKYPQAYGIKGEALSLLGDYAKAFNELNTAAGTPGITPREKAIISLRRARIYSRSDRPTDAARIYATISEPGEVLSADANVHNEIGLFYEKLFLQSGDERYLDSASAAFGEASRLATLNPIFLYNQAEVEFRRQKFADEPDMDKVLEIIEKISHIDPDYAPARLLLGRVYFHQQKAEEAERIYQSVAPQLDKDSMALLALAEAYIELGRYEDAIVAVERAREYQPWNRRLQALGKHIQEAAANMMQTASAAEEAAPVEAEPIEDAFIPEPSELEQTRSHDKYYLDEWLTADEKAAAASDARETVLFEPFAAEPMAEQPVVPTPVETASLRPTSGGHPLRPPAARAKPAFADEGELVLFDTPMMHREAIQSLREPAMPQPAGATRDRLPMTRVELPGEIAPPAAAKPAQRNAPSLRPLDLGYTPGNKNLLGDNGPKLITDQFADEFADEFNARFGGEDQWNGTEREAVVDSEGYIQFGMIQNVSSAYASMPVVEENGQSEPLEDGEGVRIPPIFTFEPDTSPVIIADVRSQAVAGRRQVVRNANLYKRHDGERRPAEIIEHEPVSPRSGDAAAMVGPNGPAVPRAEVRLPSSSLGVGMTTDYPPAP